MAEFYIYIQLEPYIRQWFINEMGGDTPISLKRGSTERDILEVFLQKQPTNTSPYLPTDTDLAIAIPCFKHKDPTVYNYLPAKAVSALVRVIKARFDIQLWTELHRFGYLGAEKQELIYAWMELHGIEMTETNWNAIAKRYQRKRNVYNANKKKC